jgi:hypothetical protein
MTCLVGWLQHYRQKYSLEPLVKTVEDKQLQQSRKRATVGAPHAALPSCRCCMPNVHHTCCAGWNLPRQHVQACQTI